MRNTKERLAAVKRRSKEMEIEKEIKKGRLITSLSLAASLIFILGLSFAMSGIIENFLDSDYSYLTGSASIFYERDGLGYLVLAIISFLLGVSVTILSYRIQRRNKRKSQKKEEDHG